MKYLLDTCVVSEPTKRIPNERAMQWLGAVPIADTWRSVVRNHVRNPEGRLFP